MTDVDDLEFGCLVFSFTHQDGRGFVGGVVVDIDEEARSCVVLPNVTASRGPQPVDMCFDELSMDQAQFGTRDAGVTAIQLFGWLSTLTTAKARERRGAAKWGAVAVALQTVHDAGPNLPGYEARYRRDLRQRLAAS